MKKIFTTLATLLAITAVILSVLPVYGIAIFPLVAAAICLIVAYYLSKKVGEVKKIIQFTFFLIIITTGLVIYKVAFNKVEVVTETQEMVKKDTESKKEAIKELEDLDLDDLEIE